MLILIFHANVLQVFGFPFFVIFASYRSSCLRDLSILVFWFWPSYNILDLEDVANVLVADSISQSVSTFIECYAKRNTRDTRDVYLSSPVTLRYLRQTEVACVCVQYNET